jgi:hypothetical protein
MLVPSKQQQRTATNITMAVVGRNTACTIVAVATIIVVVIAIVAFIVSVAVAVAVATTISHSSCCLSNLIVV